MGWEVKNMGLFNCNCRANCTGVALVVSVLAGIIAAFLQVTGAITLTVPFLWVLFGIGVGFLAKVVIAAALTRNHRSGCCPCTALNALLVGALGTILTALVLLGVDIPATSLLAVLLVGLLIGSFTLLLTASACLVRCLTGCGDVVNPCE